MTVLIHLPKHLPEEHHWDNWCAVGALKLPLDSARQVPDLANLLESHFDQIREEWWLIGRQIASSASGDLSHAATCCPFTSDFGLMLAWLRLISTLAGQAKRTLVVTDDPWLYQAASELPNVQAGRTPSIRRKHAALAIRGILARLRLAGRAVIAHLSTRTQRSGTNSDAAYLMVYGHPASTIHGYDAYFGTMMLEFPELKRILHTDCPPARAKTLAADGRTSSLHAWAHPLAFIGLPWRRWRLDRNLTDGPVGTLLKRAEALEGAGAAGAATWWQNHCQFRWLADKRPRVVAWPWENHPWERQFVSAARQFSTQTVGYQHASSGRHMWNQSPRWCPEEKADLPDKVVYSGPAYGRSLVERGVPPQRLILGGSLRFSRKPPLPFKQAAPVFVPLSNIAILNQQLMASVEAAAQQGFHFLVKTHPLYPFHFQESERVRRTDLQMHQHPALSGVLYTNGTVGLEAILGCLPTFRFRPAGLVAYDVLPEGTQIRSVDADSLIMALSNPEIPQPLVWEDIFAEPQSAVWQQIFSGASA